VRAIALGVEDLETAQAANRRLIKDALWASERLGCAAGPAEQAGHGDAGGPSKDNGRPASEPTYPPPAATKLYTPAADLEKSAGADGRQSGAWGDAAAAEPRGGTSLHHLRGSESYSELNNSDWLDSSAALLNGGGAGGVGGLLGSAAVRRFVAGARWGARPVSILGGLGLVTDANAAAWRAHAERVDELARAALLPLAAGTLSVVLGVETLGFLTGPLSPSASRLA
jgi:hypothetical protein